MSLHWWQDQAIDNPSLWMAEDGSYSLSVYKERGGWGYTVWYRASPQSDDVEIEVGKRLPDRDTAMVMAEHCVEDHKAKDTVQP